MKELLILTLVKLLYILEFQDYDFITIYIKC